MSEINDELLYDSDRVIEVCNDTLPFERDHLNIAIVGDVHLSSTNPSSRKDDYAAAILRKISYLASQSHKWDAVLFLGDIFHLKRVQLSYLMDCITVFRQFQCPTYTIVGNHDIYYEDLRSLRRSPLGILTAAGSLKILGSLSTTDNSFYAEAYHYGNNSLAPSVDPATYRFRLALAHAFWGQMFDMRENNIEVVSPRNPNVSKWSAIALGHDHVPYPTESKQGPLILRPGSLSRGSLHSYQLVRDVSYDVLTIAKDGSFQHSRCTVPVAPADEVMVKDFTPTKDITQRMKDFMVRLSNSDVNQTEDVYTLLEKATSNSDELRLCREYLKNHGFTPRNPVV
jgi:hypothetical protein